MSTGMVAAVQGPVIDVTFAHGTLPKIHEALLLEANGRKYVMEVQAHIGADTVRCIMMAGSEGIARGMEVSATGNGICVPVGECTLGRMFNVLGDPIDGEGDLPAGIETAAYTGSLPPSTSSGPKLKSLKRASRSSTCWSHTPKAAKIGLFGGAGRRKNSPDSGADSQRCHRARRLFGLCRRRGTQPRGKRPVLRNAGKRRVSKNRTRIWTDE